MKSEEVDGVPYKLDKEIDGEHDQHCCGHKEHPRDAHDNTADHMSTAINDNLGKSDSVS